MLYFFLELEVLWLLMMFLKINNAINYYSNLLPDVHGIVKKHMDVLYRSSRMREVFKEPP